MMTITLPVEYETKLEQTAQHEQVSPSDIIKEALAQYFSEHEQRESSTPYKLGQDLFGNYGSGEHQRSTEYKTRIKKKLYEKYAH